MPSGTLNAAMWKCNQRAGGERLHVLELYRASAGRALGFRPLRGALCRTWCSLQSGPRRGSAPSRPRASTKPRRGKPKLPHRVTFDGDFHVPHAGESARAGEAGRKESHGFGGRVVDGCSTSAARSAISTTRVGKRPIDPRLPAILIEPVQGDVRRVRVVPPGIPARSLRQLLRRNGCCWCFRRAVGSTAWWRTGRLFAFPASGVAPDIMGLATRRRSFPLGACSDCRGPESQEPRAPHGSTWRQSARQAAGKPCST